MIRILDTTTILIIDDMPSNLGLVVNLLEDKGYRVSIAQDGEEALRRADFVMPGLILLDVMMPGMDGFEVCRRLKLQEETRHIPVIFMTALASTEHKVKGFEVGGIDYITKPLQLDEVVARVGTHLQLYAARQRLAEQNRQLEVYQQELEQRVAERTAELSAANRRLSEEVEERKRTQERLTLLDYALNQVKEAAYLIGGDARFRYVNDEACRALGYSREELLAMNIGDIDPLWTTETWENHGQLLRRQGARHMQILETKHRTRDGREFPVEINASYFEYLEDGYNLILARDITERSRLEQELARSEIEFRTLAENSPDIIVRYDRQCRRIYFNRRHLQIGLPAALTALGKTPVESWWLASPSPEEYTERLQRVLDTGEADEVLVETNDAEGHTKYFEITMVPEYGDEQEIASVLAIGHDMTGVKHMEAMLRQSELEFRTLAENSPDMIIRYDRDCRRVYINPAYQRETGVSLETAWLKTPTEVGKPAIAGDEYMGRLRRVMTTGRPERILLEWRDGDGKLVSHDLKVVAEYGDSGEAVGVLVIGRNVTELKDIERRLEESRAQLRTLTAKREEAREEERKRIAREIHDELGQLLNVLRLHVTTLDFRFGDAHPGLRGKAQKMVDTVDRAIQMVRNLATRLRPAVMSAGIVPALEWLLQEYTESTGIVSELHVSDEDIHLDEDRAMVVFRIVQESLTNVLRHAEAERVDIFMRTGEGLCDVEVRDNGKGFDADTAVKANSYGIVGMRERAMILKGTLEIFSAEGGGTILRLRIPAHEDENIFVV